MDIARATEYAAEDADCALRCTSCCSRRSQADEKLNFVYEHDRDAGAAGAVPHRAQRRADRRARSSTRRATSSARRCWRWSSRRYEPAGQPFNLGSPKQIGEILFDKLKLPVKKKTPSGEPSTDEDVLAELALDYPLPQAAARAPRLSKLKGTYTDKLPQMVNPQTGRVHTTYAQAVAVTGRLASNDPNLQNIPIRTPQGRRIREAFIAPPGTQIVSADYSQIELRIMAHLSRRREPAARLRATARTCTAPPPREVFGVPLDKVEPASSGASPR